MLPFCQLPQNLLVELSCYSDPAYSALILFSMNVCSMNVFLCFCCCHPQLCLGPILQKGLRGGVPIAALPATHRCAQALVILLPLLCPHRESVGSLPGGSNPFCWAETGD